MDEHFILDASVDSDDPLASRDVLVLPLAFRVPVLVNDRFTTCIEAESMVDL